MENTKPQYIVIAEFPNNKDFPIGKLIDFTPWNGTHWQHVVNDCQGERMWLSDYFEKYPHLFAKVDDLGNIPDYQMYDAILPAFQKYMRKELESNYKKGDRSGAGGWLQVKENKFWLNELYYHVGKLQSALMSDDIDRVKENTADIANLSMMLLDVKINLLGND